MGDFTSNGPIRVPDASVISLRRDPRSKRLRANTNDRLNVAPIQAELGARIAGTGERNYDRRRGKLWLDRPQLKQELHCALF
jgi:hypothetical protein